MPDANDKSSGTWLEITDPSKSSDEFNTHTLPDAKSGPAAKSSGDIDALAGGGTTSGDIDALAGGGGTGAGGGGTDKTGGTKSVTPATATEETAEKLNFKQGPYQWLRKINLTVFDVEGGKGTGLDLSNFRIDFRVTKQTNQSPNFLEAKIYNLHPDTVKKVRQFHKVQLSAGYRGNFGMIFDGTVVMYITGKDNPVDSFVSIIAGDQDTALSDTVVNLSFAKGSDTDKQLRAAFDQAKLSVGAINFVQGGQPPSTLRHSSYLGGLQRFVRDRTNAADADFFVDDGKSYVISRDGYRVGEIVKLDPTTGLVGFPKVTPSGIEAQCLLNPKLRIAGQVEIKTAFLQDIPYEPGSGDKTFGSVARAFGPTLNYEFGAASISATGIYKILLLTHHGDSRGNPWYSEMVCTATGKVDNPGTALQRSASAESARLSGDGAKKDTGKPPNYGAKPPEYKPGEVPSLDPAHPAPSRMRG